jgi:hypothetical protein
MPHHPKEETTEGSTYTQISRPHPLLISCLGITDKVAKESKDSTASDHPIHDEDQSHISSGGKAHALDHHSKGPVINQDIGEPASKDELRKRAEELNKK